MLTKRQKQVLDYINKYQQSHGFSPSLEEIAKHFHLASVSTAHYHVTKLQHLGLIQKEEHQPRSVSVSDNSRMVQVPVIGTIAAGEPIEAIETGENTLSMSLAEMDSHADHYALRVRGNSMIEEGIFDGDVVVIKKQPTADNGQMVVAIVDDNAATLKKFYRENGRFRLQPANPSLFPMYRDEVEIRGIVVKIIRNYTTQIDFKPSQGTLVRRIDTSWDYRGAQTKSFTHGLHPYPAMFIPQVARRLLETYSQPNDTVCDIFCGSGTTLLESKLLKRYAYGIDLNPFATFLAQVKTTPLDGRILTQEYFALLKRIEQNDHEEIAPPTFKNIEFWFKPEVIRSLTSIKAAIQAIPDIQIRHFFLLGFGLTVRLSSNTKAGEFKLVRKKPLVLEKYQPDVMSLFRKITEKNIEAMRQFTSEVDPHYWTKIILSDASKDAGIAPCSIDCILTSPPYGDSRTTVAYGQFSRLSAQWIDIYENPNEAPQVDKHLLGGEPTSTLAHDLHSEYLRESLEKIAEKDEKRAREVLSFYVGLNQCMRQAYRLLKPRKYFCIVVGNRSVKQVRIPTDFIMAELGQHLGFTTEDIFVRNIPGKRMPSSNSPTNEVGVVEETMNKESVVILRKD